VYEIVFFTLPSGKKPVREYIKGAEKDVRGRLLAAIDVLREEGFLTEPRSKSIAGVSKLRELRIKHARGISRILYLVESGPRFILLHGFTKKTPKTPKKEIDIAVSRMKQYLEAQNG